jgi:cellulose synthase/poly-beta-1,6-N-acetylglucosamine synthase-like glycosyltransferase
MPWAVAVFCILAGLAAGQAVSAIPFLWTMRRARRGQAAASSPKTAVVLCLRGCDPFLPACLEAILKQDYPCYDLRIVVDSREDPAWKIVEQVVARCSTTKVQVRPLTARRDTCSLKCSSLLQALSELDDSYEAVALLDADTVPHRTWLAELVAPLADERVGAATGNR